jgi:spore photoproduct lyase
LQYLNDFSHIYVEKEIQNHPFTQEILSKFPKAQIIEIEHYKDKFNSYSQNFRSQKHSQKLILAKKEAPFLYEASELIQKQDINFLYTTPMLNCIYDCHYCFLQGMYPSSNVVLFVNLEDFFSEVENYLKTHDNLFLSISYDTDVLAVENLFGIAKKWIEFAKNKPLKIEIRTKAVNIDRLPLNENVILSFSLSPDEVISKYELKTPNLDKRINAIKKVISKGYKPSIAIDPIIKIPSYKDIYKKMIDKIFSEINSEDIESIIFGTFRMNSSQFKTIKKAGLISDLLYYDYEVKNKKVAYKNDKEIIEYFRNLLSSYKEKLFYV